MINFNYFITISLLINLIYSVHSDPIDRDSIDDDYQTGNFIFLVFN